MVFPLFIAFVVVLRIGELLLSNSNEKWLLKNGAVEYGNGHYPFIVALHVLFILSLVLEYCKQQITYYSLILILLYFLLVVFKAWVILSLGKFWNTKIYHISGTPLIKKGPYKYLLWY